MFSDKTPIALGDLTVATTFLTTEIIAAVSKSSPEADERLERIASRFLDAANATDNPRGAAILGAIARGLIATEDTGSGKQSKRPAASAVDTAHCSSPSPQSAHREKAQFVDQHPGHPGPVGRTSRPSRRGEKPKFVPLADCERREKKNRSKKARKRVTERKLSCKHC